MPAIPSLDMDSISRRLSSAVGNFNNAHAGPNTKPAKVPMIGQISGLILNLLTIGILALFLTRRISTVRKSKWRQLPLGYWMAIAIYVDSLLFILISALLSKALNINESRSLCDAAILLCLLCYLSTKVIVYYLLVEKAYVVRASRVPRLKDKLWLFNFFGVICPFLVVIVLNFYFRFAFIDDSGTCIIGMERIAIIPLLSFDVLLNVYLTILFLIPLIKSYSSRKDVVPMTEALRTVAFRTFWGCCGSLLSSIVNITVLIILNGEPGWICLTSCNSDILFTVIVFHWVTTVDVVGRRCPPKNRVPELSGTTIPANSLSYDPKNYSKQYSTLNEIYSTNSSSGRPMPDLDGIDLPTLQTYEMDYINSNQGQNQEADERSMRTGSMDQIIEAHEHC
ncbi:MAG: hypothetical protein M1834_008374 [Cirrosporium novae-zelandiae]|nr:MAG: hypothetical protein M1834_008374 [Cirrosporium novae-zelandiae]